MSVETEKIKELLDKIDILEQEKSDLEYERDNWEEECEAKEDEIENLVAENALLELSLNRTVKDLDNFVKQCEIRGIWSDELTEFLEDYLKFFND